VEVSRHDGQGRPVLPGLVLDNDLDVGEDALVRGMLRIVNQDKTIAAGSLDASGSSYIRATGQGGVADNLDSITGGVDGQQLILVARETASVITVRDNSVGGGNIYTAGAASRVVRRSSTGNDVLVLMYFSLNTHWAEVSYSDN